VFDRLRRRGFDLLVRNHAEAILSVDFADETDELVTALSDYALPAAKSSAAAAARRQRPSACGAD